jgi:hypothetical protein
MEDSIKRYPDNCIQANQNFQQGVFFRIKTPSVKMSYAKFLKAFIPPLLETLPMIPIY